MAELLMKCAISVRSTRHPRRNPTTETVRSLTGTSGRVSSQGTSTGLLWVVALDSIFLGYLLGGYVAGTSVTSSTDCTEGSKRRPTDVGNGRCNG